MTMAPPRPLFELAATAIGATAPNPPVVAAAFAVDGTLLDMAAHQGAGTPHAEALLLANLRGAGRLERVDWVYSSLEPCNHHGRTPPCSHALVEAGIRKIAFGLSDPNDAARGGAEHLRTHGIKITEGLWREQAIQSLAPFLWRVHTGKPFLTVKTAHRPDGGMIPPAGQTTFTSARDLAMAHQMRKSADAIVTGSGTILADSPAFTVRHVPDHDGTERPLVILDRRRRVPEAYLETARRNGLDPVIHDAIDDALAFLSEHGCLNVLCEAGPALSAHIRDRELWQAWAAFHEDRPGKPDLRLSPAVQEKWPFFELDFPLAFAS